MFQILGTHDNIVKKYAKFPCFWENKIWTSPIYFHVLSMEMAVFLEIKNNKFTELMKMVFKTRGPR